MPDTPKKPEQQSAETEQSPDQSPEKVTDLPKKPMTKAETDAVKGGVRWR